MAGGGGGGGSVGGRRGRQPDQGAAALSTILVPELALVLLVGPSGSGKSTFARRHFRPTEILSSDFFRAMVADDESDQSATGAAFELLHLALARRLQRGRLTVVDATNLQGEARRPLLDLARRYHVPAVGIVFDLSEALCVARNAARVERTVAPEVVRVHRERLDLALPVLSREGVRSVWVFRTPEAVDAAVVAREPLPANHAGERGPFDIIGDVHGCGEELVELLRVLNYRRDERRETGGEGEVWVHPEGRKLIFVGDLVDRGPGVAEVLRIVMGTVTAGGALAVPGNHDDKLMRALRGRGVQVKHGLQQSLEQLAREPAAFRDRVAEFIEGLPSHLLLDERRLVVAHAGMKEGLQGRESRRVRDFALYGETTGEMDEFGLPVRYQWATDYRGRATVVYGHTPVREPEWVNDTINIDTGCVFGGRLTALRYPERELVSVPARRAYAESRRFVGEERPAGSPAT